MAGTGGVLHTKSVEKLVSFHWMGLAVKRSGRQSRNAIAPSKAGEPFEIEEDPNIFCFRYWPCDCRCSQDRKVLYATINHGIFGGEFFRCDKRGGKHFGNCDKLFAVADYLLA